MSTATRVPQTYELEGDDAVKTLRTTGTGRLLKNSFMRFRAADGFSHSRALAYQIVLTSLPALIAVVGFATSLHQETFRTVVRQTIERLTPGAAGKVLTEAFAQGTKTAGGGWAVLALGLVATLFTATTTMGQIERGANRIYGIEQDRPSLAKYTRAFVLACSAGLLIVVAFLLLVGGSAISRAARANGVAKAATVVLDWGRWPLGIVLVVAGFALLFKHAPNRRQPDATWLAFGSGATVLLWLVLTALLQLYLTASKGFGKTYGSLAGLVGLFLWALFTSLAIHLGLAFAAQLEAVRAGVPEPKRAEASGSQSASPGVRR